MQGVVRAHVSDLASSFQANLVFRLIHAHLSRPLPRLEHSLDTRCPHLLMLVVALVAHRSGPRFSASRNVAVQQQREAGITTGQRYGSKSLFESIVSYWSNQPARLTLTY